MQDQEQDRRFINNFIIVMGFLVVVAIIFIFIAHTISDHTVEQYVREDPLFQQQVDARLAPIGHVVLLGGDALKAAQAAAAATSKPAAAQKPLTGHEVFAQVCTACHSTGAGGAPVVGNAAMWDPRIAEGLSTLEQHALHGFQGSSGVMPAKGGRPDLSDAEVIAAVKYMIGQDPDAPADLK